MSDTVTLSGTVADVFAHRFTLTVDGRAVLADLGPKGAERVALAPGDVVTVTGERKPSEIKVLSLLRAGASIEIPHGPKPDHPKPDHPKPHHPKPHDARPHDAKSRDLEPRGTSPRPEAA